MVREPIKETSSHATRQGTRFHSRLSSLSHCGLILGLKEWNFGAHELISTKKQQQYRPGKIRPISLHNPRTQKKKKNHKKATTTTATELATKYDTFVGNNTNKEWMSRVPAPTRNSVSKDHCRKDLCQYQQTERPAPGAYGLSVAGTL